MRSPIPIGDRSGSGECWLARNGTNRSVIKVVVHEHEPGRFDREVEALARLNSPRVMRVQGRGELTAAAGTFPYLKSEFVPGGTLSERLQTEPPPDDPQLRGFLLEFLKGLVDGARAPRGNSTPATSSRRTSVLRDGRWDQPVDHPRPRSLQGSSTPRASRSTRGPAAPGPTWHPRCFAWRRPPTSATFGGRRYGSQLSEPPPARIPSAGLRTGPPRRL